MCFFSAQLHAMRSDPDYVRWPSALSVGPSWWELRVRVTDRDCSELVNPNPNPNPTPNAKPNPNPNADPNPDPNADPNPDPNPNLDRNP